METLSFLKARQSAKKLAPLPATLAEFAKLPLSKQIRVAQLDARKALDRGYYLNMHEWLNPEKSCCCLAGAVLLDYGVLTLVSSVSKVPERNVMLALDSVRRAELTQAFIERYNKEPNSSNFRNALFEAQGKYGPFMHKCDSPSYLEENFATFSKNLSLFANIFDRYGF